METWRIIRKYKEAVLAGDLNIYTEDQEAADFLSGFKR